METPSNRSRQQTRLALVQMRCGPDPSENRARAVEKIREAARRGAGIVCLPELFASQYFCQSRTSPARRANSWANSPPN